MDFYLELKQEIEKNNLDSLNDFINHNIKCFFNSPNIYKFYQLLVNVQSNDDVANLIIAWLALLSGDNLKLTKLSMKINPENLNNYHQSFLSDLKALSSIFGNPKERLLYSNKTLELLPDQPITFYHGNAYLTRGQIYNSLKEYRSAFTSFYKSYEYFFELDMMFPASVALSNALLNKIKLADFEEVIKICKQTLLIISSYNSSQDNYWDVLYLPMGISYLEQNEILLAIDYLEKAFKAINELDLIHMHGFIELYLFKVFRLHGDSKKLKEILDLTKKTFENMHYPLMTQILYYGEILLKNQIDNQRIAELKRMYEDSINPEPYLVEMLLFLGVKYNEEYIPFTELINYIENLRYNGDITHLQILLLLLADYYYLKKEYDSAKEILEEAINYYHDYHLKAAFNMYDFSFWPIVKKIDSSIKPNKVEQPLLTEREMDILLLISQGLSNQEISERLFITIGTVKWHINHILSKLDCKNRIQALKKAKKINIIT